MALIEAVHSSHENVEGGIRGLVLCSQRLPQYIVLAGAAKLLTQAPEAHQPASRQQHWLP